MDGIDPQQLLIGSGALVLLGYATKKSLELFIPYLFRKIDERDEYIKQLTVQFTETINHKTTEWTVAVNRLAAAQEEQIKVFKKLIDK